MLASVQRASGSNSKDEVTVPMQIIQGTRKSFTRDSKEPSHITTSAASPGQESEWSVVPTKQEEVISGLKNKVDSLQGALRRSDARNVELQAEKTSLTQANRELQKSVSALNTQCATMSAELRQARNQNLETVKQLDAFQGVTDELMKLNADMSVLTGKLALAEVQEKEYLQEQQEFSQKLQKAEQLLLEKNEAARTLEAESPGQGRFVGQAGDATEDSAGKAQGRAG